jgi:hypothetical protein
MHLYRLESGIQQFLCEPGAARDRAARTVGHKSPSIPLRESIITFRFPRFARVCGGRKLITLNLLLVLASAVSIREVRIGWDEAQSREKNLNAEMIVRPRLQLRAAPLPDVAPAAQYAAITAKDLFVPDRNSGVIIAPPKVEEPRKMPPLPVVYGVLGLPSGVKAIMSERTGVAARSLKPGDTIGEYKVISLDLQSVVFEWDGRQISRDVREMIDHSENSTGNSSDVPKQTRQF